MRLIIQAVFLMMLARCSNSNAAPDLVGIVRTLMAAATLSALRSRAGSAAKHYLERRVLYLTSKNSDWASECGFTSLTARLGSEMKQAILALALESAGAGLLVNLGYKGTQLPDILHALRTLFVLSLPRTRLASQAAVASELRS
jgi:hypothetical protein